LRKGQQRTALGLLFRRKMLPLGPADGAERIASLASHKAQGIIGKRLTVPVDGDTADIGGGGCQLKAKPLLDRIEHIQGLFHHFRANAIAGQYSNFISG
jgi:hypothetical protein